MTLIEQITVLPTARRIAGTMYSLSLFLKRSDNYTTMLKKTPIDESGKLKLGAYPERAIHTLNSKKGMISADSRESTIYEKGEKALDHPKRQRWEALRLLP